MAEEKLSMEGLDTIQAEESATTTQEMPQEQTDLSSATATDEEGQPSDFMAALKDAMSDEPVQEPEPEPEPEPNDSEPVGEVGEIGEVGEAPAEENLSPSAANFKKIKQDRDNARRELEELKSKLASDKPSEDFEKIKRERDELSEELKVSAIERHPEFKRKYEEKAAGLLNQAKDMVGVGLGEAITTLMFSAESDARTEKLDDIFSELPVSKQARLANIISEMDALQRDRQIELENANSTYEQLMQAERETRSSNSEASNKLFDEVSQTALNLEFFQKKSDDAEWNKEVDERYDLARRIYTGASSPEELVLASCWAAVAPKYREAYGAQIEVNKRLRAQIKELTGASPAVSGSDAASEKPQDIGFLDHLKQVMDE